MASVEGFVRRIGAKPMDVDRCRSCGRAFSPGEVAGLGILRPRLAVEGGPLVEFACPGCRRVMRLIPHGNARYAHPGEPPPPPPAGPDRLPPWLRDRSADDSSAPTRTAAPPEPQPPKPPVRPERRATAEAPATSAPPSEPAQADGGTSANRSRTDARVVEPMDPARACAVLGISVTADRAAIERAYRARALQCHPDKVAHLDEEFRALAERKFKEIQAAYDLLAGG